jgi:ATP-dependent DNA ligase
LGEDVVLDGEAVVYSSGGLDFTALRTRMNRRPDTVAQLAADQPAHFIAFDLLEHEGTQMFDWPYRERRAALVSLFQGHGLQAPWALTPSTTDREQAERWLKEWAGVGVEGVVAKGADQPYLPGRRGWRKIRARDTAEAIVGAVTGPFTYPSTLLLGRYSPSGRLRLVARTTQLPPPCGGRSANCSPRPAPSILAGHAYYLPLGQPRTAELHLCGTPSRRRISRRLVDRPRPVAPSGTGEEDQD